MPPTAEAENQRALGVISESFAISRIQNGRIERSALLVAFLLAAFSNARAQWDIQDSHTTAALRGIHSVNGFVAWASGTQGTVLRTEDGGSHWRACAVPEDGDQLDVRGVWAWDRNTAMIMSSGPGDRSRLFETRDGCAHWREIARNSDKEGFWDALVFKSGKFGMPGNEKTGVLLGDPVGGRFSTQIVLVERGRLIRDFSCPADVDESAFAASNSSVFVFGSRRYIIGTGGMGGPRTLLSPAFSGGTGRRDCREASVPLARGSDSSGVFSIAFRDREHGIAVGGDYKKPDATLGTAAWTSDGGLLWSAAARPPHGFRSAVSFWAAAKAWITAGTNGSDVSYDDGKTWQVLDDGNWNAISLPYAVGPGGRIGRLRPHAVRLRP